MRIIDDHLLHQLTHAWIEQVIFYKRDEITTDLVCCDVETGGGVWSFHEEMAGWELLLRYLEDLPDFRNDWYASVSQPPFALSQTIAFSRNR